MSPCCDCFTRKKKSENKTEQNHSKYNGNLNQSKFKITTNSKSTEANSSHLNSTAVASRPRISAGKNIRKNRPTFNNQCSDPDCPFNRTRVRQTMPAGGARTRTPRRTQTHRNENDENSRQRRVKRTQSYLPPPPDVTPPRPPRTPLPPVPRQKSFIHDKYVTTEESYYSPSPSPEPEQYRDSPSPEQYKHQDKLPIPQVESRPNDFRRRTSAGEEVLKALRKLRPLKKSASKDSTNSEYVRDQKALRGLRALKKSASKDSTNSEYVRDHYDAYTSSYGSSHGDLASNATQGYIPPAPPMPAHLLSYRNVLKPSKKTILPEEKTKPITVVGIDPSKKKLIASKIIQFARFHKKVEKEDSIEVLDVQTNQKYNLNAAKPSKNKHIRKDISIVSI